MPGEEGGICWVGTCGGGGAGGKGEDCVVVVCAAGRGSRGMGIEAFFLRC